MPSVQAELLALQEKGLNDVSYAYIASMAVPHVRPPAAARTCMQAVHAPAWWHRGPQ